MSNPRSLADFTISRIAARSAFPDRAAVLSIRLVREFTPDIFSIITGPSWLTRIGHSASYTVPRIDPGLAVIGDPTAVDRFLLSEGLSSTDLAWPRLGTALSAGAAVAQAGSEIAANSGRWVKLTKESAQLVHKHGLRE